jgi:hypothetical protein
MWRDVVEKHQSALMDELASRLDAEVRDAVSRAVDQERSQASEKTLWACEEARRLQSESLNQALRRLRQGVSEEQVLTLLNEGCSACSERSVVLVFENNQALAVAGRGIGEIPLAEIAFEIAAAPAVVSAIDSQDRIVALATENEISSVLARALASEKVLADEEDGNGTGKAYLFPVIARHSLVAMLIAAGAVCAPPIELLCEAAGMKLEAARPAPTPSEHPVAEIPELVQLAPAPNVAAAERRSWDDLSADDRQLHLKAQRTARVRVSEMRLYHDEALRRGINTSDIYGALRPGIDAARDEFRETFIAKSSTMVDYFHLEILRNLAQDNDRLLGPEYPGPMV